MKVISIFNQKGGVGKTTTSINLCSCLAMNGYKILNIDIDPQGNTTSGMGLDKNSLELSVYNVLTSDEISIKEAIKQSELISNFYILPSTMSLAGAEIELINKLDRERILLQKLKEIENDFDYVFIDCPPSLGLLTINALAASDSVLIPIQCEFYSLEGVGQLVNTIELVQKSLNSNLEVEGVILSMYDIRTRLCNEVAEEVKNILMIKYIRPQSLEM